MFSIFQPEERKLFLSAKEDIDIIKWDKTESEKIIKILQAFDSHDCFQVLWIFLPIKLIL